MRYDNIIKGTFLVRQNRFVAHVLLDGKEEVCHVKNTGRLKEIFTEGATVYLEKSDNPDRKTAYDLVAAEKDGEIINIDSQAPNKAAGEYLRKIFPGCNVKAECKYGSSRFDFYIEGNGIKAFAEVKGVTLFRDGRALFPDAPTERGVKHVRELTECISKGYEAYILFVIQSGKDVVFAPNEETHPQFAEALRAAESAGVHIMAVNCDVTADTMTVRGEIPTQI